MTLSSTALMPGERVRHREQRAPTNHRAVRSVFYYGFSRYLPYPESDARDLPIKELAGYRTGSQSSDEVFKFYTFPAAFEQEIARGFNHTQFAGVLASAGILETGDKGRHKEESTTQDGRQAACVLCADVLT